MNVQTKFWAGKAGDDYATRNGFDWESLYARMHMWEKILHHMSHDQPKSILEVGANIGLNLRALEGITGAQRFATEPNESARLQLELSGIAEKVTSDTADKLSFEDNAAELVFTCGVLIHVHPDRLKASVEQIHRVSSRYILCAEYFSDKPGEIEYRGQKGLLWKRDFGSFYMDTFPDLRLVSYGFEWKPVTKLDNLTWWLFEKPKSHVGH